MIAKNKKNRFAKVMSMFLVGIFAVFLAFMPFMMNKNKDKVLADSVATGFNGSNIYVPTTLRYVSGTNFGDLNSFSSFELSSIYQQDSDTFALDFHCAYISSNYYLRAVQLFDIDVGTWVNLTENFLFRAYTINDGYINSYYKLPGLWCYIDSGMSSIIGVTLSFDNSTDFGKFSIAYFDSNNKHLIIDIYVHCNSYFHSTTWGDISNIEAISFDTRTYYFLPNFNDNQFYNQGYSDGYSNGESAGYNAGNQAGYSAGYSAGESAGYNDGVVAGGNVSWTNMFGAMVDVPVSSLVSMLDFNLNLGGQNFNLYHFLLAVLTLAITIAIVRLILAKGGK